MSELLTGQVQVETRMDAKFESLGEMLRNQIANVFKEQQSGTAIGKGKDLSDSPNSHAVAGSSSGSGGGTNRDRHAQGILSPFPVNRVQEAPGHANNRLRLEFPKFNGENPKLWLRKCLRYFDYNLMPDYDKLSLVAMNLEGIAD